MKKTKKILVILMTAIMVMSFTACGGGDSASDEVATLTIAHQYGMAYAPLEIMKQQELIEKHYDGTVEIDWTTLNSGSAITEGFASGSVDVGAMGVAPAVTAVTSGVPVKICSNMSAQPHKLMTNDPTIKTLKDVGSEQIALINIGSIQHILLAMAAEEQLGDAHALDNNIVAMAHPDGMTSLLSGSIKLQLTTSPYTFKEEAEGMTEVEALESVWPEGNSFIVALASTELQENNPELYEAVVAALAEAIDFINNNKEEAAEMLCEAEDVDVETMLEWLNDPACAYMTETKGIIDMANFMVKAGFLEHDAPQSIADLAFDNVEGN